MISELQDEDIQETQPIGDPSSSSQSHGSISSGKNTSESSQEDTYCEQEQPRRSKRGHIPKKHVGNPLNAESSINKEVWRRAMLEEINAIERNGTWKLVDLPKEKKAINLK